MSESQSKAPPSPAALARVELLIRTWLLADEAADRAWDDACRAQREAVAVLGTVGGSIELDGWRYTVILDGRTIERRPVRTDHRKRGAP